MRVAVVGIGALGGYFGGLLARAGVDVTCLAQGPRLIALQTQGVTVRSMRHGEFTVRPAVTGDPAAVGVVDLVLFCVKAYDLDQAATQARPLIGPRTLVVPVQNGIDVAERIARVVGRGRVLGGAAYVGAYVESPGVIVHTLSGRADLIIGALHEHDAAETARLAETLSRSGIATQASPAVRVALWEKFGAICAATVTTATRLPTRVVMACAESRGLVQGVLAEVVAVAQAEGISLRPDYTESIMRMFDGVAPTHRQSMAYDLEAGRRLEIEFLNGALVRRGRALGVPTPLNFALYALIQPYETGAPAVPAGA